MTILRVSVSVLLILFLLYLLRDKYDQIFAVLKSTNVLMFSIGVAIYMLAIVVASYRLSLIIAAQDIPIKLTDAASLSFIGYFFNNFLPTSIGGDVVKAYYLSKRTKERTTAYMAIFVDRAIGLVTMMFMAFVALLFVNTRVVDSNVRLMIYGITVMALLAITFMLNKRFARMFSVVLVFFRPIEEKLKKAYNTLHNYRHHTRLLVESLAISVLSQLLFFTGVAVLGYSIGASIPAQEILLRMPIISAMSLLPSINGLGVREGATVLLFGPLIGKTSAFAISVLWLFTLFITSFFGGLIYLASPQFKVKLKEITKGTE